jgi:zinc/manganese transport system substrate-binding protein
MRMILSRNRIVALALVSAFAGTSCGDSERTGWVGADRLSPDDYGASSPAFVATTSIWGDIASRALCNVVPALLPAGADPHGYEPSLRDRESLEHADVIFTNGGDLEGPLLELVDAAARSGATVVELLPHVAAGNNDPHIWQDPTLVAGTIDTIAGTGVSAGLDPVEVTTCAAKYQTELATLDAEIAALIETVSAGNRLMVTSHDSLGYFADRYGIEIVGTVIPSTSTLAETNAADLATLAETIDSLGVPAVFTDHLESSRDADRLAERIGVTVVPLVTDALTTDPDSDTYIKMMRSNAAAIAEALTP